MKDFWIACGHHLLDRDANGGLVVTDEFLKAYFARPELMPPDDACTVERRLHRELLADPRRTVSAEGVSRIAAAAVVASGPAPDGCCGGGCRDRRCGRTGELEIRAGISQAPYA